MLELAEQVDVIVLASGDGDFDLAIKRIQDRYRISTEVYGVQQLTANSLITATQKFIPIEAELLLTQP
jgi:uncharacterized LabA/DUF88 family protein